MQPAFIAGGVRLFISIAELGELLADKNMTRKIMLLISTSQLHLLIVQSMVLRARFFLKTTDT